MVRARRIFCVVAYDISDDKRRNQVMKLLEKCGERINLSVYECMFTPGRFKQIRAAIMKRIDINKDVVVYYPICVNCYTRIIYQPGRDKWIESILMA